MKNLQKIKYLIRLGRDLFFLLTFPLILFKVPLHELRTEKYFNKFIGQLVVAQL
jgi:hypothetical protein